MPDMLPLDGAKSTLRVIVAQALAETVVLAIDCSREEGRPLGQRQQTDLIEAACMSYATAVSDGEASLATEAQITQTLAPTPPRDSGKR